MITCFLLLSLSLGLLQRGSGCLLLLLVLPTLLLPLQAGQHPDQNMAKIINQPEVI